MSHKQEQADVVASIIASLQEYLVTKDFDALFSMGSKLSFVAYTLDGSSDAALLKVVPSLIRFTEITHKIANDPAKVVMYEELIEAYLKELKFWLVNYFLEEKHELLASNIIEILVSSVENMELFLNEASSDDSNLDDIFF